MSSIEKQMCSINREKGEMSSINREKSTINGKVQMHCIKRTVQMVTMTTTDCLLACTADGIELTKYYRK